MNNTTDQASSTTDGGFSTSYKAGVTVYAVVVFIVAVVGNSLVIYIVSKREYMRNPTNILIANMAVADILMACIVPYVLKWLFVGYQWFGTIMGTVLCKLFHSVQVLSIACSVISLVFISLDRFVVFWFPMRRIFTNKILKACLVASWVYALAFAMPFLIVVSKVGLEDDGLYYCFEYGWPTDKARQNYVLSFFIGTYIIPLFIITISYILIAIKLCKREIPGVQTLEHQKKAHATTKKAITMLVTVVVVFAVCWLPLQAREIMLISFPETISLFPKELEIFLTWIGILNSAINPCLYVIFSENFRREFGRILCCCLKQNRPEAYLGIPASRGATPTTTPLMSRRTLSTTPMTTPLMSLRALSAPNKNETVPLRHLTLKH